MLDAQIFGDVVHIITEKANSNDRLTFNEKCIDIQGFKKDRNTIQQTALLSNRILNKPFWIWSIKEHKAADILTDGDCCFNHINGLPMKNGEDKPFFDYEKMLFDSLQQHKHIWIKKATGLSFINYYVTFMGYML